MIVAVATMTPVLVYSVIMGTWTRGIEAMVVVALADGYVGWQGWGLIEIFGQELIVSDLVYYGILALASFYVILK